MNGNFIRPLFRFRDEPHVGISAVYMGGSDESPRISNKPFFPFFFGFGLIECMFSRLMGVEVTIQLGMMMGMYSG